MIVRRPILLLFLITILAFLLRFYQLGQNPPGINLDEAAIGFNAYSILKTGRDEYGQFLPIVFRSHDDYKPPLYIYLTIPAIALFGENEFAVRFPSAILGVLAVITVYFLTKELFPQSRKIPLIASFLLAISPWHLQFTRVAYETGSTVPFTSLGLLFFLKGLKSVKVRFWLLSAIFFGLELYLYQASKVFIPLFVLFLLAFTARQLWVRKRNLGLFLAVFTLFLFPIVSLSLTPAGQMRFQGTSIFQDSSAHNRNVSWRVTDWLRKNRLAATVFHPDFLSYSQEIMANYFSHFRLDFLFLGKNGPPIDYVSAVGLLFLWELPFVLPGVYFLWLKYRRSAAILTAWFLLAPLPAAVSFGAPSSIRTTLILPTLQIFTALGIVSLTGLKRKLILLLVVCYFLAYYLHMMLVHSPNDYSQNWFYSYKDVVSTTSQLAPKYQKVIVSTTLQQPHNFFAFFLRYDPWTYINIDGATVSGGFREDRNHFSKYFFQPIDGNEIANQHSILYVGKPADFPSWVQPIKTFHYLNGDVSVIIVGT